MKQYIIERNGRFEIISVLGKPPADVIAEAPKENGRYITDLSVLDINKENKQVSINLAKVSEKAALEKSASDKFEAHALSRKALIAALEGHLDRPSVSQEVKDIINHILDKGEAGG